MSNSAPPPAVQADSDPKSPAPAGARPRKRLAVFLDGTWNDPDANTNVWRLHVMTAPGDEHGIPTLKYYDPGVGTHWYDRFAGGALGYGLSENVEAAYQWLIEHYDYRDGEPDDAQDALYLFGFSRGAFTARTLAGFIARCGLLHPGAPISIPELFDRYRRSSPRAKNTAGHLRALHEIEFDIRDGKPVTREEQALFRCSRRIPIHFIGVFDTVGALGIPFGNIPGISSRTLSFHNTNLSVKVRHAYHALAIDENRAPYRPTLWNQFLPTRDARPTSRTKVEQRWFIGAHANVGGGYRQDPLPLIPLVWMHDNAYACGLRFRNTPKLAGDEHLAAKPTDSYAQFLHGFYRAIKFGKRYYRPIQRGIMPNSKGFDEPINETIDPTVIARYKQDQTYRPPNLVSWVKDHPTSLETHDDPAPRDAKPTTAAASGVTSVSP